MLYYIDKMFSIFPVLCWCCDKSYIYLISVSYDYFYRTEEHSSIYISYFRIIVRPTSNKNLRWMDKEDNKYNVIFV